MKGYQAILVTMLLVLKRLLVVAADLLARDLTSLAWPDRFFPFLFVVAEKSGLATRD